MLLEVLGCGCDELDGDKLETAVLETRDDWADESALGIVLVRDVHEGLSKFVLSGKGGKGKRSSSTCTPSGLTAMKLCDVSIDADVSGLLLNSYVCSEAMIANVLSSLSKGLCIVCGVSESTNACKKRFGGMKPDDGSERKLPRPQPRPLFTCFTTK